MRADGRSNTDLRAISVQTNINDFAEGSCIFTMGRTRIHCTASLTEDLPRWRQVSGKGWVTAEYRMLPRATTTRSEREGRHDKKGRTAEIERLIGRSLRAVVDLSALGPRQITIDCDVLQADGGTRCASINGGFIALTLACQRLVAEGKLPALPLRGMVSAISVGIVDGEARVDLPYVEDANARVDLNVVGTSDGRVVEIQGCAEGEPFPRADLQTLIDLGLDALPALFAAQRAALPFLV